MFFLSALCLTLKCSQRVAPAGQFGRGFCSKAADFRDLLKSRALQKYFDGLPSREDVAKSEQKFLIDRFVRERSELLSNVKSLADLKKSSGSDEEFRKMLDEERVDLEGKLLDVEMKLLDLAAPQLPNGVEIIVEISAGVGGKEAMLFAGDLRGMYLGYVDFKRWNVTSEDLETADIGGVRHTTLFIEGKDVLKRLWHESGVHRVQRIPATEKNGRIHTSTVTVAVFPQPRQIDVNLDDKDIIIETKRSSGAGGQHVNKTESAVRITHVPTGISVECQTDRSQIKNRQAAYQKLCAKLYSLQEREQTSSIQQSRKMQVGTRARSDKIRTYNYPQDRITDHRISRHLHNMEGFLQGEQQLDSLLNELIHFSERERLESFVSSLSEEGVLTT